ncbi:ABC transporter substrate-binding protein [Priestia megaterium]|nr:ABC transporter substrate-binding protein [Priestia megaterium]
MIIIITMILNKNYMQENSIMNNLRKAISALIIMTVLTLMAACSDEKASTEKSDSSPKTRVVKHLKGKVEIPVNPKRIVDISGSTEELLILGHKPVGTANAYRGEFHSQIKDQLPKETVEVGSYWTPQVNVEAILKTKPDLIIMNSRQEKVYEQMEKIAPTIVLPEDIADWKKRFVTLGEYLGKEDIAKDWITEYEETAAGISKEIKEKYNDESVMFLAAAPKSLRVYGNFGYADILFNDLKLKPVEGTPVDELMVDASLEVIPEYKPDHMFIVRFDFDGANELMDELQASPFWSANPAVKEGNVYEVDYTTFMEKSFGPLGKLELMNDIKEKMLKE